MPLGVAPPLDHANDLAYLPQTNELYHVLYSDDETVPHTIYVYNWSGHFVTKIPFGLPGCEPENISIVGDKIYIGCNNDTWSGGVLYEAVLLTE